jgi:hypothetical protein
VKPRHRRRKAKKENKIRYAPTIAFPSPSEKKTIRSIHSKRGTDYMLGLKLSNDEVRDLNHRSAFVDSPFQSVNQGQHKLISKCPNFLDIEVKKLDSRDAKAQLGTWAAAGYKKKVLHGWSTELPMLALGIQNHEWRLHVGCCIQSELVSMMPDPVSPGWC